MYLYYATANRGNGRRDYRAHYFRSTSLFPHRDLVLLLAEPAADKQMATALTLHDPAIRRPRRNRDLFSFARFPRDYLSASVRAPNRRRDSGITDAGRGGRERPRSSVHVRR